jgi:hypothetical protein
MSAGAAFGVLAALTKSSTWLLGQGAVAFFTAWEPYAMAFAAIAGIICQQSAFQAAPLPASMPVMDSVEPTVAVLIGVFAFQESLATSALALAGEAAGIVALITGIVVLDRSRVVLEMLDEHEKPAQSTQTVSISARPLGRNSGAGVTDGAQ